MTITLRDALGQFLDNVKASQSKNTWVSYYSDLLGSTGFLSLLKPRVKPSMPINELTESMGAQYMQNLLARGASASTRQRRAAAIREFFKFVRARKMAKVSAEDLDYLFKSGKFLSGIRDEIRFDAKKIDRILTHIQSALSMTKHSLIDLRDRAFILTLAETGLRVQEACNLRRGDIDWKAGTAIIVGKGQKQEHIRFGKRSLRAVKAYLQARSEQDGRTGNLAALPIFSRHDKKAALKSVPIGISKAEQIIHSAAAAALGYDYDPSITCHTLRHYFVTRIWSQTGDLKLAQEMARHSSVATTTKYTHITDSKRDARHAEIFDE